MKRDFILPDIGEGIVECEIVEYRRAERGIGGSRRAGEQAAAIAMLAFVKGL